MLDSQFPHNFVDVGVDPLYDPLLVLRGRLPGSFHFLNVAAVIVLYSHDDFYGLYIHFTASTIVSDPFLPMPSISCHSSGVAEIIFLTLEKNFATVAAFLFPMPGRTAATF